MAYGSAAADFHHSAAHTWGTYDPDLSGHMGTRDDAVVAVQRVHPVGLVPAYLADARIEHGVIRPILSADASRTATDTRLSSFRSDDIARRVANMAFQPGISVATLKASQPITEPLPTASVTASDPSDSRCSRQGDPTVVEEQAPVPRRDLPSTNKSDIQATDLTCTSRTGTHERPPPVSEHLIGAFGMFWKREEVNWKRGSGPVSWELLGYLGQQRPGLRVCNFRRAAGFYVLWNDYRATYVGLARGDGGLGARLRAHNDDEAKDWSRFSWFSFDDVQDRGAVDGWAEPEFRNALAEASTDTVVRECEALLITVLGTYTGGSQRRMGFQAGREWTQVTTQDYAPGGVCRRVARDGFADHKIFDDWD